MSDGDSGCSCEFPVCCIPPLEATSPSFLLPWAFFVTNGEDISFQLESATGP